MKEEVKLCNVTQIDSIAKILMQFQIVFETLPSFVSF